jgi:hypothetical protein
MTKPELLTALAQSPEGQQYRVRFVGLAAFPQQRPFDSSAGETTEVFVRAVGRYYNGREPAEDSLARWVALLDSAKLSREEVVRLFAASAGEHQLDALSSAVADMRRELEWHQRAIESFLPPRQ